MRRFPSGGRASPAARTARATGGRSSLHLEPVDDECVAVLGRLVPAGPGETGEGDEKRDPACGEEAACEARKVAKGGRGVGREEGERTEGEEGRAVLREEGEAPEEAEQGSGATGLGPREAGERTEREDDEQGHGHVGVNHSRVRVESRLERGEGEGGAAGPRAPAATRLGTHGEKESGEERDERKARTKEDRLRQGSCSGRGSGGGAPGRTASGAGRPRVESEARPGRFRREPWREEDARDSIVPCRPGRFPGPRPGEPARRRSRRRRRDGEGREPPKRGRGRGRSTARIAPAGPAGNSAGAHSSGAC